LAAAHARFGSAPVPVDLDALYRRLGVRREGERVTFDEQAELAGLRRSLVSPAAAVHHDHDDHDRHTGLAAPGVP
jgi:hypothetical protein